MTDIFISYSRKDKPFVQKLHQALAQNQKDVWVDWEDIPLTADWWAEIQEGIEAADTFVFVISPDSIASEICMQEVDYATQHNKRLVPIVYRDAENAPHALSHLNWLFFRETDDFDSAYENLIEIMDIDLDWVKIHTRLIRQASEWEKNERNGSYLLRGDNLADAEVHLSQPNRKPALTPLQQAYIVASQQQQAAKLMQELEQAKTLAEAEKRRLEEQKRYNARLRRGALVIIGALVLVIVMGVFAIATALRNGALVYGTDEIVETIVDLADSQTNSDLCWVGSLNDLHAQVMPACEMSVTLDPQLPFAYESRGLARAMLRDLDNAASDFEMAIKLAQESNAGVDKIPHWQEWLAALKRDENPFHEELLEKLRDDWEAERKYFSDATFDSESNPEQ